MKTANHSTVRRLVLTLLLVWGASPFAARGQTFTPPGQVSFQGFVTDANGFPLATNQPRNYDVIFKIWPASSGGTVGLWGEQQTVVVDRGYFSVMLGQGAALASGEPWTNNLAGLFVGPTASDRYVGITVKGISTPDAEIQPRLRLLASPYAFLAASANAVVNNAGLTLISGASGSPIFNMTNATFNGAPAFNNGFSVANGTTVSGNPIFNGAPTFSGNPSFNGNPNFNGTPTFNNVLAMASGATMSGNPGFTGTPTFRNGFSVYSGAYVSGSMIFSGSPTFASFPLFNGTATFANGITMTGGSIRLNDLPLYIRGDSNHGLVYAGSTWWSLDGPVLFGYSGGALGANQWGTRSLALVWDANGVVTADPLGLNTGGLNDGTTLTAGLVFGGLGSGEGISSKRTSGGNLYGLDFYTDFGPKMSIAWGGNVGIGTTAPGARLHVIGNIYATSTITPNSDRNAKTDFAPVDSGAILEEVSQLPIEQWRFKVEEPGIKHVGPMAQDFRAAFGLGDIPTAISTVDADGVALAAIQGLNQKVEDRSARLEQQLHAREAEILALRAANDALEKRLQALEKAIKTPTTQTGTGQ